MLLWERQSLLDRQKIYEYLHQFNPEVAELTDMKIQESAALLKDNKELGVKHEGIKGRLLIIPSVSLILSYEIQNVNVRSPKENIVRIMRVLHDKQLFPTTED